MTVKLIQFYRTHKSKIIGIPIIAVFIPLLFLIQEDEIKITSFLTKTLWSGLHALLIWTGSDLITHYGRKKHPSLKQTRHRLITVGFGISVIVFVVVAMMFLLKPERQCSTSVILQDLMISFVFTTIVVSLQEAEYFFSQWKISAIETERLQKQTVLAHYEMLKNQINPHFLFNSLNTLTSLIHQDPYKAEKFTEEFSNVYRYLLEMKDQPLVSVAEELRFVKSYFFLQKKRYENNLVVDIQLSEAALKAFIPPVSMQLLVENAIKHNIISSRRPLIINIADHDASIVISNNLQLRNDYTNESTGIGLQNITNQYKILSDLTPTFKVSDDNAKYIATLPLLQKSQ